jgi:hypothetical protein
MGQMGMMDVKATMMRRIDELFANVGGNSSDATCEEALRVYLMSAYSDLASLSWYLGCEADVFQREAVPASELAGEAYFSINREREFAGPSKQAYSAMAGRA